MNIWTYPVITKDNGFFVVSLDNDRARRIIGDDIQMITEKPPSKITLFLP